MSELGLLSKKRNALNLELDSLDQATIEKYKNITKQLDVINRNIKDLILAEDLKNQKNCAGQDGHAWAVLGREFVSDHKCYTELTCECVICGAYETREAKYFNNVIDLKISNHDNILIGTYVRMFVGNFLLNLMSEKGMSKKDAIVYIQKNSTSISEEFKLYYSTQTKLKTKTII